MNGKLGASIRSLRTKPSDYRNLREIVLTVSSPIFSVKDEEAWDTLDTNARKLCDTIRKRGFSVLMDTRKVEPPSAAKPATDLTITTCHACGRDAAGVVGVCPDHAPRIKGARRARS